jgi:putative transposase
MATFKQQFEFFFLQAEMNEHLGYSKHSVEGNNSGNSRNGVNKKEIKTNYGVTELSVPLDRNGEFEPQIIKKYERTPNGIEEQVVSMYAKGMSTRDIEDHLKALPARLKR